MDETLPIPGATVAAEVAEAVLEVAEVAVAIVEAPVVAVALAVTAGVAIATALTSSSAPTGTLVSDGATFSCNKCSSKLTLKVATSSSTGKGDALSNVGNFFFPPPPGGQCLLNPAAPTPCTPSVQVINPGQTAVAIDGKLALGSDCKLLCVKTGLLTVDSTGQTVAQHNGANKAEKVAGMKASQSPAPPPPDPDKKKEKKKEEKNKSTKQRDKRLPKNPDDLLKDPKWKETTHPDAKGRGHRSFENNQTGEKLRYDEGKPGSKGHKGESHWHRTNPASKSRHDEYLDANDLPVPRGSDESHLYPP